MEILLVPSEHKSHPNHLLVPGNFESVVRDQKDTLWYNSTKRKYSFEFDASNPHKLYLPKEGFYLDILGSHLGPFSCSCRFFLTEQLNDCVHTQALSRGLKDKNLFTRTKPIIHFNSLYQQIILFGIYNDFQLQSWGLSKVTDFVEVADEALLRATVNSTPELFSGAMKNFLSREKPASSGIDPNLTCVKKELFPFQRDGVSFLLRNGRTILADDMGLGKTIQSICAAQNLFDHQLINSVLVICPSSVKMQWKKEIESSTKKRAEVFHNSKGFQKFLDSKKKADYIILNYELVNRNVLELASQDWGLIILDEAQKIKNFETKSWESISMLRSKFLFLLTGTPIENKIENIYNLMSVVDSEFLGPRWKFDYTYNIYHGLKVVEHKNLKQLREKLGQKVLRRGKQVVLKDLPDIIETTRYVEILPQQKVVEEKYVEIARNIMRQGSSRELTFQERQIIQQSLLKARLACNAPELVGVPAKTSPKIDELQDLLEEIQPSADKKVIIFSEWVEMLKLAQTRIREMGYDHVMFNGSVHSSARQNLVESFINDPNKVLFLSSEAGGVGLNLQNAHYVIHLDLPWNPARLDQRNGRAHRINQKNNVIVNYIVAKDCIEEGIETVIASKRALRQSLLTSDATEDQVILSAFTDYLKKEVER